MAPPPESRGTIAGPSLLPLHGLLEVTRLLHARVPLAELLDGTAVAVARSLGFAAVVVNLYRPREDRFEVTTVVGSEALSAALLATHSTRATWEALLDVTYERDGVFLIPAGAVDWDKALQPSFCPERTDDDLGEDAWLPEDALFAPMRASGGELLGVLSVDEPVGGRRPDSTTLQTLAAVAAHAALAVEQCQVDARAVEHSASLARLVEVAARLSQTLDPVSALRTVCDAVRDVLGFQEVVVGLREGSQLLPVASCGVPERLLGPIDVDRVDGVPWLEREGIFLLEPEQARELWPVAVRAPIAPAGPRTWNGHLLVVPLRDPGGGLAGAIAVGAPADGLLPDRDRLRVLRMFAAQAATTLHSAPQRALREERGRSARAARHDALTGLPNRAVLIAALAEGLEREAQASMLFLDLDDFRIVNDSLGHQAGDDLLCAVAARLGAAVESHLVCRLGGDEFGVLVEGTPADAVAVAERVHRELRRSFRLPGADHHLAASVGIAPAAPGDTPSEVLKRASIAMDQAKAAGAATLCYDANTDRAASRLETVAALRSAATRGELELHYQPIVRLRDHKLMALEALLRWRRDGKLIAPLEFIELAETSGAIELIGAWVIETAAAQARAWRNQGLCVPPIAVNVSPRQLRRGDLAVNVAEVLARHHLEPEALSIEITESALLPDLRLPAQLRALREIGVACAIDDFGAEHSSLGRLRELPVDILKIDRAFLRSVPDDPRAVGLLHAIVALAGALDLTVVAEGVETVAQEHALRAAGGELQCQGWLYSRALPAAALTDWLRAS